MCMASGEQEASVPGGATLKEGAWAAGKTLAFVGTSVERSDTEEAAVASPLVSCCECLKSGSSGEVGMV